MPVTIDRVDAGQLPRYARVPIRFLVRSQLRVEAAGGGLGGLLLTEEAVDPPYVKDYDAQEGGGSGPERWPPRFDVSRWAFLLADDGGRSVGGATVVHEAPDVRMLDGRRDLALLWDIRVHPGRRGEGIGAALFRRAAEFARRQGCRQLKVETQNVNVPACRFYLAMGCHLGAIHCHAYAGEPSVAHEAMLLWYLDL